MKIVIAGLLAGLMLAAGAAFADAASTVSAPAAAQTMPCRSMQTGCPHAGQPMGPGMSKSMQSGMGSGMGPGMHNGMNGMQQGMMGQGNQSQQSKRTQQKKTPAVDNQDVIYGSQLMTPDERAAYRAKMLAAKTDEERARIRAEHHKEMQARAKKLGKTLPPPPR